MYDLKSRLYECLKKYLDQMIHPDQTRFIKGRNLSKNIRTIYDIMQYTEEENIPGLFLLIDFEKAFDSVSWSLFRGHYNSLGLAILFKIG